MGNNESKEEKDGELRKIIKEAKVYLKKYEDGTRKYNNPSLLFRNDYFVGINQKIDKCVFYENGRTHKFDDLSKLKLKVPDQYFDITVSDPQNDEELVSFLEKMKGNYDIIVPSNYRNRKSLEVGIQKLAKKLISEVIDFYGRIGDPAINKTCEETTMRLKMSRMSSLIYLGEVKGCGLCRHRSILFKLLCDIFNIDCRILRGWMIKSNEKDVTREGHMWNEIQLKGRSLIVDCMNFSDFVENGRKIGGCIVNLTNLGHPLLQLEDNQQIVDYLKAFYSEDDGKDMQRQRGIHLGSGGFGNVYEIQLQHRVKKSKEEEEEECEGEDNDDEESKYKLVRRSYAIKELDLGKLLYQSTNSNSVSIDRVQRIIKREIDRMTLLRHPNIVNIIGHFKMFSEEDDDDIIRIIMKKYDMNGFRFLRKLRRIKEPYKQTFEVLKFLLEVTKGLSYIHSFGIIHFDIKLENLLLNWDSEKNEIKEVVISDFGSSKEEKMNLGHTTLPTLTPKFAAPEILELKKNPKLDVLFTSKSDVYSFGKVIECFDSYLEEYKNEFRSLKQKCFEEEPEKRPSINEISEVIIKIMKEKICSEEILNYVPFVWGQCYIHGTINNQLTPKIVSKFESFKSFHCGFQCCSIILLNGSVLCWGKNYSCRLGNEKRNELFTTTPSFIKLKENRKIIDICHSLFITLFLDNFGCVWGCGYNERGFIKGKKTNKNYYSEPQLIISEEKGFKKIRKINCSEYSSFFSIIDENGKLYTWGYGDYGRLGHGTKNNEMKPKFVEFFKDIKIKSVKMGEYHSLFLDQNGKIYSCGRNNYGQLGFKSEEIDVLIPNLIPFFDEKKIIIVQISCGDNHCSAIDSNGNLYLWGNGDNGQIGNGKNDYKNFIPIKIMKIQTQTSEIVDLDIPKRHKFIQISCGEYHNICLLEERNENEKKLIVLTWGGGKFGRLGFNNKEHKNIPTILDVFNEKKIIKVIAGGFMSAVLCL